ncbi:MAG: prepilin-type N-terminal cleavage/methylation domain-containing protein [bacterium]
MKKNDGFTLVEIMIVVVIIGILAAVAIPRFVQTSNDAKSKSCAATIANINAQWETKFIKTGSYGTLAALTGDPDYFPDGAPTCALATPYADADSDNRVDAHTH